MRVHHSSSEGPSLRPRSLSMFTMRLNCLLWMLKQLPNHVDISHVPVCNGHVLQGREKANCILAYTPASKLAWENGIGDLLPCVRIDLPDPLEHITAQPA